MEEVLCNVELVKENNDFVVKIQSDLGITVNNLYQIKSRIKKRIAEEIRFIRENSPDGE